jgi:topoisomerase-4 subunit A
VGGTLETCGVKEGDRVRHFVETNTSHTALFFTQDGKYFATLVNSFPDDKWKDIGSAIVNVIPLEKQQKIVGFTIVESFKQPQYVFHVSRLGLIKKTALSEYETNRSGALVAAKLKSEDDEFVTAFVVDEEGGILGATRDGMGIRFQRSEVSPTGRASSGVKAIALSSGDEVIMMMPVGSKDTRAFSLLTTEGVVKRTAISDIPLQGRAGKGVQLIRKRKNNPHQLIALSMEETMYAWTTQNEWSLVSTDQVIVNEQGGIGRSVVEGGAKAVAFETVLPTEETKEEHGKGSGEGSSSPQRTLENPFNLFDGNSGEKKE